MVKTRTVTCVALIAYVAGVFLLALHPANDVHWAEAVAMVLAVLAGLGLVAYLLPGVRLPAEGYAYLITGWAGLTVLLLYLVDTADPSARRAGVALFLASGALAGYGSWLAAGEGEGDERRG